MKSQVNRTANPGQSSSDRLEQPMTKKEVTLKTQIIKTMLAGLICAAASVLITPLGASAAAYVRSDSVNSVVYEGSDYHIYELYLPLGQGWNYGDLTAQTGAPLADRGREAYYAGQPAAYIRSDEVNSVVYRGSNKHIYELYLPLGAPSWKYGDLTAQTGAPLAKWGPVAYRRSDRVNAVVYVGADNHIYELYLPFGAPGWKYGDLTAQTGAPLAGSHALPAAYVRSDKVNAVVYVGADNHIYELYLPLGQGWKYGDLTAQTGAPLAGYEAPAAYVRSDQVNSVVYVDKNNYRIYELYLPLGQGWKYGDLTAKTGAPTADGKLSGYVRSDGVNSVVYKGSQYIAEVYLVPGQGWKYADLTTGWSVPIIPYSAPDGYRRSDNVNSVPYCGDDNHIHELYLPLGAKTWQIGDLSLQTSVTGCHPVIH